MRTRAKSSSEMAGLGKRGESASLMAGGERERNREKRGERERGRERGGGERKTLRSKHALPTFQGRTCG